MPRFRQRKNNILKSYFLPPSCLKILNFGFSDSSNMICEYSDIGLSFRQDRSTADSASYQSVCPTVTQLLFQDSSLQPFFSKTKNHTHTQTNPPNWELVTLTTAKPPELLFAKKRVTDESFLVEAAAETTAKLVFYFQSGQDSIDSFLPAPPS